MKYSYLDYFHFYLGEDLYWSFPGGSDVKGGRPGFDPCIGKIHWRRKWQPTPVLGWKIPWMEEPGELQSLGLQRVGHD